MKSKELIKILQEFPDFEVILSHSFRDNSAWGIAVNSYKIDELGDMNLADMLVKFNGELLKLNISLAEDLA